MKKISFRIVSLLLILATVVSFASCGETEETDNAWWFDFTGTDLSSYLKVTPEDYSGFVLTVTPKTEVTDDYIMDYLFEQEGYEDVLETETEVALQKNDLLTFYYYVSLDGTPIQHLTNYTRDEGTTLRIGVSNSFLSADMESAFMEALLAEEVVPADYTFERRDTGIVGSAPCVFATVKGVYTDSSTGEDVAYDSDSYCRIDLTNPEGIYHYLYASTMTSTEGLHFNELTIGESAVFERFDATYGLITYTVTPEFVMDSESTVDIDITFPAGYDEGGSLSFLGGKTAVFHVCPRYIERVDEEFYPLLKSYLEGLAESDYESEVSDAIVSELQNRFFVAAVPDGVLEACRKEVLIYFDLSFADYKANYSSTRFTTRDEYLTALFSQTMSLSLKDGLNYYVAAAAGEYMMYYTIAQTMGITLSDEIIDATYDNYLQSAADTEEGRAEFVNLYNTYYGEGYLRYYVSYCMLKSDVIEAIKELSVIKESTAE